MSDLKVYTNIKMWISVGMLFWCATGVWVTVLFISRSQAGKLDLALWRTHLYAVIPVKQQESMRSFRKLADLTSSQAQLAVNNLSVSILRWPRVCRGVVCVFKQLCSPFVCLYRYMLLTHYDAEWLFVHLHVIISPSWKIHALIVLKVSSSPLCLFLLSTKCGRVSLLYSQCNAYLYSYIVDNLIH